MPIFAVVRGVVRRAVRQRARTADKRYGHTLRAQRTLIPPGEDNASAQCAASIRAAIQAAQALAATRRAKALKVRSRLHVAVKSRCPVRTGRLLRSLNTHITELNVGDVIVSLSDCSAYLTEGSVSYSMRSDVEYAPYVNDRRGFVDSAIASVNWDTQLAGMRVRVDASDFD